MLRSQLGGEANTKQQALVKVTDLVAREQEQKHKAAVCGTRKADAGRSTGSQWNTSRQAEDTNTTA